MTQDVSKTIGMTLLALGVLGGCSRDGAEPAPELPHVVEERTGGRVFLPLPEKVDVNPAARDLGYALFQDPRLSGDGEVACTDCHELIDHGGADGKVVSEATADRGPTALNTPTVFNLVVGFRLGWDGKHLDMEAQLDAPMMSDRVMRIGSWDRIVDKLEADSELRARFRAVYPERGVTPETIRHALAEFQRSLLTPNSDFDKFLRGDDHALPNGPAADGYALFQDLGCVSCHQGRGVGGNLFQKFGVVFDYPADRPRTPADDGRYNYTHDDSDIGVFRVPSLRNVEVTAPYFHDGSAATLEQAVETMGLHQLGLDLTDDQICRLVAFLRTLTGELPEVLRDDPSRKDWKLRPPERASNRLDCATHVYSDAEAAGGSEGE